jgi:5-methylcytosine-specific restriction protein A
VPEIPKLCSFPGCSNVQRASRCPAHRRGSAAVRGYGRSWKIIRQRYLRGHPVCEAPHCPMPASDVHHVDGRGPLHDNSPSNLVALCHRHHSQITARGG